MTSSFVRRYPGFRGLGQDTSIDPLTGVPYSVEAAGSSIGFPTTSLSTDGTPTTTSTSSSSGINWNSLIQNLTTAGVKIGQQFASYANPLYGKNTFVQTPQGLVYATNATTSGVSIPGLTTATTTQMLPILLIGGGLLVLMMAMKR